MGASPKTVSYWFNMLSDGLETPFTSRQAYEHICNYTVYSNGGARRRPTLLPANVSAMAQILKAKGPKYGLKRVDEKTTARYVAKWNFFD